jgi:hypothetical protein
VICVAPVRSRSLPRIARYKVDNTSPLLARKKRSLAPTAESPSPHTMLLKTFASGKETSSEMGNKSIMRDISNPAKGVSKDKKLTFSFPAISGRRSPTKEQTTTDTELLGKKVLEVCQVLKTKSPVHELSSSLRKGSGHGMAGFGLTNQQLYEKVFAP